MSEHPETIERTVAHADAGRRLDVFLAAQPEVGSRSRAKALVRSGAATLDGRRTKAGTLLRAGQVVRCELVEVADHAPRAAVEDWPFQLRVLFEDPHILVVDKPAGLAAHRPERPREIPPNVADMALYHCGELTTVAGEERPGIVHRLDKDTTGVMVLAKTDEASHFLRSQFKARTVFKEYRAISFGESRFDSDYIERPIGPHPRMNDRMVVVPEGGKAATTFYEVVERFDGFTHFRCLPRTGRTHQIRVHLTSVGHSLVGDKVYRSRRVPRAPLPEGAPDPGRQCLHALRIEFRHPRTHEEISFDAPLAADMSALLEWFRLQSRPR